MREERCRRWVLWWKRGEGFTAEEDIFEEKNLFFKKIKFVEFELLDYKNRLMVEVIFYLKLSI